MKIKYILYIYNSRIDRAGNCYFAFCIVDTETGKTVRATMSGGDSNIRSMVYELNGGKWVANVSTSCEEMGIRDFNRFVKHWPFAGCTPQDLAAFVTTNWQKPQLLDLLSK